MDDYTQLIETLRLGASISRDRNINLDYAKVADEAAQAIEALQARCVELTSVAEHGEIREQKIKKEFERVCGERDAALAKLKELEAQEPVGAVLQSATNYDSTWSFICSSKQYLKTGIPIYTRPIPAQPTARTYMDGYSDGKKWALDRTLTYAEIDALCVGERLTIPQYSARIKIARAIEAKLKEGL